MEDDESNPEYINHYLSLDEEYIAKYGNCVAVFYQVGKFYQLYGTEERMKQICYNHMGISIRRIKATNIFTGGYPMNALKKYTKLLFESNYIVIVYDQDQHPTNPKKKIRVFKQQISGTTVDDEDLMSDNQTIACVYIEFDTLNISNVEICTYESTTGVVRCIINNHKSFTELQQSLIRLDPKQIVIYTDNCLLDKSELVSQLMLDKIMLHIIINNIPMEYKKINYQNHFLESLFVTKMLTGVEYIGLGKYPSTIICYILLLQFMKEFNPSFLQSLNPPIIDTSTDILQMSDKCMDQFNLFDKHHKSLFNIIDHTSTLRGKKFLKYKLLNPSTNIQEIESSYQQIELMMPHIQAFETQLDLIMDIEKLHRKIHIDQLNPSEIQYLAQSYASIINIIELSKKYGIGLDYINHADQCQAFYNDVSNIWQIDVCKRYSIDDEYDTNIFKFSKYPDLDALYQDLATIHQQLDDLAKLYGQQVNKSEPLKMVKPSEGVGFHVSETQKTNLQKIYAELEFVKKASGYRMSSVTIRNLHDSLTDHRHQINTLTKRYHLQCLNHLSSTYNTMFGAVVTYINQIDVTKSNAKTALLEKYCKPIIKQVDKSFINSKSLRHPIIEKINDRVPYVANDCMIGDHHDGILLYGTNGSGKTAYSKMVGIVLIMAQAGMYVPAESFVYSIYKKIGVKMISADDIYHHKSLFVNEVLKIKEFLALADANTLIIGDELGTGTEYPSQVGLITAIIKYLAAKRTSFIFTCHIHDLLHMDCIKNLANLKISHIDVTIEAHRLIYQRHIKEGGCPNLYGIEIASFLGLPDSVIADAYQIRDNLINGQAVYRVSHFNQEVIMTECQICKSRNDLQTHHITEQHRFRVPNNIPYNKNIKHNLVVLCKRCHDDIHHQKKTIVGYRETSDGIELQYEF